MPGGCCGQSALDAACRDEHGEGFLPFLIGFAPFAILASVSVVIWLVV